MTCIVALIDGNKVYLGGDGSASEEKTGLILQRIDPKVFRVGQFGIGFVDSFRMGQILQYSWTPPVYKPTANHKGLDKFMKTKFVDSVKEAFKDGGFGNFSQSTEEGDEGGTFIIAVQGTGRLFTMDPDFHIGEYDTMYMSEGSGQMSALGSLFSTSGIKSPRKRVRLALEAAAKFNMSVRPPFTIIEV